MKPEVRQAITWVSRAHPTLALMNGAVARVERYKKQAQDDNSGEKAALAIRNLGIVLGVAATTAAAVIYAFSKAPEEPPKETKIVAASVCESYEQSMEGLFTEAIGRVGLKNLFPSTGNQLSFGEGRNAFMISAQSDSTTGLTLISFDAEMRGGAGESSVTGRIELLNTNPYLQQQSPNLMELVQDKATHLASVTVKGSAIEDPNQRAAYSSGGVPTTFLYGPAGCEIAASPSGLKGKGDTPDPGAAETAQLQVAMLQNYITNNLPAGPAFS